ncbi:thiopurine S-methyltransferase [Sessilibacter corallicola]|uniref:Thiopurine S-methyltransferase n=1 Tax=Sessilibacter corallicola TaxID=2904075 RepID=A0ABQ0A8R5_9GAMM
MLEDIHSTIKHEQELTMEFSFWNNKWENMDIGFHEPQANYFLQSHLADFNLPEHARIFLPLCGKTRDIAWLLRAGFRVVGIELIEKAVQQLFEELGVTPTITSMDNLTQYQADNIEIYVGDLFNLIPEILGPIDLVYDRAAIVALPQDTRTQYTQLIPHLALGAPQLVVTFEYNQAHLQGPPFAVDNQELTRCYETTYSIKKLASRPAEDLKQRRKVDGMETAWMLTAIS